MAQRRAFSLAVTDTDAFQDMPTSTQALYFHLGMHGDDDGFIGSPKKIARAAGCNDDDMRLLVAKGFVIPFESGVVVIRDWKINNTLKNDRYHETLYRDEKSMLLLDEANRYRLGNSLEPSRNQLGAKTEPEHNKTKLNSTEQNVEKADKPPRTTRFSPPSLEEIKAYCEERQNSVDPLRFHDFYSSKNWMIGKNKMQDWKAAVRTWERRENSKQGSMPSEADYYAGWGDSL